MVSSPRRQQYRRLLRAGGAAIASLTAMLLTVLLAYAGALSGAAIGALVAGGLTLYARRWLALARRSRIGARSEDEVRRALKALEAEGWRVRHSLRWRGRGDIDSVATTPSGIAFALETKTRTFGEQHMRVVRDQAAWLWRRRRWWCRGGALPVLCVVRARGVERWEGGVLVVSMDRIVPALRAAAASVTSDLHR